MGTRYDEGKLFQMLSKVSRFAAEKCGESQVGWESPEFHAYKSLDPLVRGLLCALFIDFRLGDCGSIWGLLLRLSPQHYDIFFGSTAEWYLKAGCPDQAEAAVALKAYLQENHAKVESRRAEILKEYESDDFGDTAYDAVELETDKMCQKLEWNDDLMQRQFQSFDIILQKMT